MEKRRNPTGIDFGVRVGAIVERAGEILLVQHAKLGRGPYWVLPGGRLEPGETIPECATREVKEEVGLETRFVEIRYVSEFMQAGRHTIDLTVRVALLSEQEARLGYDPEVMPGSEPTLKELRWLRPEEMSKLPLLPESLKLRLIQDASQHWPSGEVYLHG